VELSGHGQKAPFPSSHQGRSPEVLVDHGGGSAFRISDQPIEGILGSDYFFGLRSTSHKALPWNGVFAQEGVHPDTSSFSLQRVTRHIIPSYQDEEHPPRKDGLVS